MKRRTEHLVEKRDGRTEFVRATKLARSIHLALSSVGVDEDWRAIEETLYLTSIPGMRDSIVEGLNTPLTKTSKTLKW